MTDIFDISGRIAIVTGASSGIGLHVAKFLAARGARVAAAARRLDKVQEVVDEIVAAGGDAVAFRVDVADAASIEAFLKDVKERMGVPHILVNNAGISIVKEALDVTREDWDQVIGINLTGAWIMAQQCAKMMVEEGRGSIINITSLAGSERVLVRASPYTAAKAGLSWLGKVMGVELAATGVRINNIAPGLFDTNLGGNTDPEAKKKRRAAMVERIPMKRMADFRELEGPILLLASDAGSYMTGSVLVVDGGYSENSI